uniref:Glucan endo-1,3-beta-glucosidase GVI n=1 Tax=Ananas comosus var. bracteatus TaxID=296719 RepID=A0A6V7NF74_ANACO|nr:unnamed protein product [Ananas comosus var. bracteatus]
MDHRVLFCFVLGLGLLFSTLSTRAGAQGVGVNYGMLGNNLPTPDKVVGLYASRGITKLRLFSPDAAALAALRGSGISVVLGTLNEDLQRLAADQSFAANWVQTNVAPFATTGVTFRYINAGNEVIPGPTPRTSSPPCRTSTPRSAPPTSPSRSPPPCPPRCWARRTRRRRARSRSLRRRSSPPSWRSCRPRGRRSSSTSTPTSRRLAGLHQPVRRHRGLGLRGTGEGGGPQVAVVVSETGWPSGGGGVGATVDNARLYNNNVVAHVESSAGTPRRPGKGIETYLFAMFNEDEKPAGTEQNFGLYRPDMSEVYHVNFAS